MAAKKMTKAAAMRKYEASAEDKRKDAAGARKIMKAANRGKK